MKFGLRIYFSCTLKMVNIIILLFLLPITAVNAKSFTVFDALLHSNKPDLKTHGLKHLRVIYVGELWDRDDNRDEPNIERITKIAKGLKPGSLLCIDIEHWPVKGNSISTQKSIAKYKKVADAIKQNNPTVKLGFYGLVPVRDYWRAIRPDKIDEYSEWLAENKALLPISDFVDVVFPSLYTFYSDKRGWEKYAIENLKEAKKYGKPVIAFLWPRYHDSNPFLHYFDVPADFWRLQLLTCYKHADGVAIWGGWKKDWDPRSSWWIETKSFLKSLKVQ